MNVLVPTMMDPTGALRPLERQKVAESLCPAMSLAGTPSATAALKIRAPSKWTGIPWRLATALTAAICATLQTVPPAMLWVFSRQISPVSGKWSFAGRTAAATSSAAIIPSVPATRLTSSPPTAAIPATRSRRGVALRSPLAVAR
jgi:hypothetical protein